MVSPSRCCGRRSAHRLLYERGDSRLVGRGQLCQREGGRPHRAFVEVRLVAEAERRVSRLELLRALEEADDLAVLGIRGHPVPRFRRKGRALAVTMACSRSPTARSRSGISAIFASTALSPSALRFSALSSWTRSFIAARSSWVNPLDFFAALLSATAKHLRVSRHVVGEPDPSSRQRRRLEELEPMPPVHVFEQWFALSENEWVDRQP